MKRAIVEIRGGPLQGRKALLEPGTTLRVGRTERADLVVPRDERLAGTHFELAWDGERCRLTDLRSAEGTALNGERVADEAGVAHGAWIRAGETVFSVYFEEATPSPRDLDEDDDETRDRKARALAALEADPDPLFAVLNAARTDRIVETLHEAPEEYRSLYEGFQGEALADVAPYLVGLPRGSRLLARLVQEGWGERWGIYLTSRRPFTEVRRHLRRLLLVENEETRKRMYFRFYDPRVLRAFLPTCTPLQVGDFMGEFEALWMEGEDGEPLRQRGRGAASLERVSP
jgi:hypothetical protein